MKLNELTEALTLKQAKPLIKLEREKYGDIPEKIFQIHQTLFGDEDHRIYFTLNGEREYFLGDTKGEKTKKTFSIDKLIQKVNVVLAKDGYIIDNFNENKAYKFIDINTDKGKMIWSKIPEANKQDEKQYHQKGHIVYIKKNEFSITKLLAKEPDLQREYEAYYQKAQSKSKTSNASLSEDTDDYLIVISRHAYDIGGASTDREWHSCMNLDGGINKHYVKKDVAGGNLISYLIKKEDTNINKPIARVLVKKYQKKSGKETDYILYPEQTCYSEVHSSIIEKYKETIQRIFVEEQKDVISKDVLYKFSKNQYNDSQTKKAIYINKEGTEGLTTETKERLKSILHSFNEDAKKMYDNMIANIPKNKILKDVNDEILDEISGEIAYAQDDDKIKFFKLGLKFDNFGNFDSKNLDKHLYKIGIDENDVKITFNPLQTKGKSMFGIRPNMYELLDDSSKHTIVREYDITDVVLSPDYVYAIKEEFLNKIRRPYYGNLEKSKKNGKYILTISGDISPFVSVNKNALLKKFENYLMGLNLKPVINKSNEEKISQMIESMYVEKNSSDKLAKLDKEEFMDALAEAGYDNYWGGVEEKIASFIVDQIINHRYTIEDFFPDDKNKAKPLDEVLDDLIKYIDYDPNKISFRKVVDMIEYYCDLYSPIADDEKLFNFFDKIDKKLNRKSSYYKIIDKIARENEDVKNMINDDSWDGIPDEEIVKFAKKLHTLIKAEMASNKIKGKKEKKIEESVLTIYNKINSLKRIV